ncbi:MAG: hypothetical protein L6N95_01505 [Candidatus Methylarchaceae archaeon HK01B]|nr:hypothetical protein [Candidatus Methylarchaceae archaeon HK01M]MCP8318489.1 hypothetical protein [Candidatus Methylarchaceae archaeon HK01B]
MKIVDNSQIIMQTEYKKGRAEEYYVKGLLEEKGYRYIMKSAGSHTPIDLLASNGLETLAVQVRRVSHINQEEREKLCDWARIFHACPVLAVNIKDRWRITDLLCNEITFKIKNIRA